jgi:predicted TIM-barrel fold metal-dependent hydrolase
VHIVGEEERYPMVPGRTYTPGLATLAGLERIARPTGVTRFVIIQPSFYDTDNTLTLASLDVLGSRGRGVAVIDPVATPDHVLQDMARRGVRGLRINLYSLMRPREKGDLEGSFTALAHVAGAMSWHVQVIAPIAMLAQASDVLAASPVPVVIDHYDLYAGMTPESTAGQRLLGVLALPQVWMKLSGPHRFSNYPLATRPDPAWLATTLDAAAARCVWGSDWPHTPPHALQTGNPLKIPYRALDYARVVADSALLCPLPRSPIRLWSTIRRCFTASGRRDERRTDGTGRIKPRPHGAPQSRLSIRAATDARLCIQLSRPHLHRLRGANHEPRYRAFEQPVRARGRHFFLGYCLFEVPSNLVLYRVGARLWIARIMIT